MSAAIALDTLLAATETPHRLLALLFCFSPSRSHFSPKRMKIFFRVRLPALTPFLASLRFLWRARMHRRAPSTPCTFRGTCVHTCTSHPPQRLPNSKVGVGGYLFLSGYRAEQNTQLGSRTIANVLLTKRFSSPLIFCVTARK